MRGAKASFFMRYRKLSSDGDYVFGSGKNDFLVNSPEAVAQAILTRLKLWLGEWFADTSDGTGWNQSIVGKHSKNLYELTLHQRALETPGVKSIVDFQSALDPDTRRLTVSMTVNTIFGEASLNGDLTT
ncbi:putative bacteriophage protein [Acinetobacter nosocomialis]|uniref:hypothetical protein n=2 Tax=Acinetobacter nosocomialis TaxID=106654 RepID=UPI000DE74ABE|nr:hypothetical protein [Acinetobacter nosocomialis]MBR7693920.1 hypothetical protein [Acinetobacter nosocomialis]SSO21421.1 putative bacteriophage protein [Acinetobacter nosocomialis]SSQ79891.1 putative bacteriophage protein [Acinetobacter nosocomialis]HCT5801665.1 hypothetical protein [Acinetobacter nosocomialis]